MPTNEFPRITGSLRIKDDFDNINKAFGQIEDRLTGVDSNVGAAHEAADDAQTAADNAQSTADDAKADAAAAKLAEAARLKASADSSAKALARQKFVQDSTAKADAADAARQKALADANHPMEEESVGVLITGSVITVGEARAILKQLKDSK